MAKKAAIIGAGLIGRSWAITFARGGYDVAMYDPDAAGLKGSVAMMENLLADLEKGQLLQGQTAATVRKRITTVATIEDAAKDATFVQESGPEKLEVKRTLFAALDRAAPPDTVLASSSSAITPSQFTEELKGRGRCLVAHPVNPPYLIPAVELVASPWTTPAAMENARKTMIAIGQAPMILNKEIGGFVVNRLQAALLHEAWRLVDAGVCSTADVDIAVAKGLGLRWAFMGPFETIDLNAPGGVADYVQRYEPTLRHLVSTQKEPATWAGPLADKVLAERTRRLPRAELSNRTRWRDRRIMALLRHFAQAEKEIGT